MSVELDKYNTKRDQIIKLIKFDNLVTIIKQDELYYQELKEWLQEAVYNDSTAFPMNLLEQFEDRN